METELRARPSSAHIWSECAGSVQMAAPVAEQTSPEIEEGHAAHWLLTQLYAGVDIRTIESAPNFVSITSEMIEGAYLFRDTVAPWSDGMKLEFPVYPPAFSARLPYYTHGTPDAQRYVPTVLDVGDYKFGFRSVPAAENAQLVTYTVHLLDNILETYGDFDYDITVNFTIIQPRDYTGAGKVKRWSCKGSDLRAHANRFAHQAKLAVGENPPVKVGPWCADCHGRARCEASRQAGAAAIHHVRSFIASDLLPHELSHELTLLNAFEGDFKARRAGLEALIENTLRQGGRIPGWVMAPGRPSKVWDVPDPVTIAAIAGFDVAKKPEPVTPTQAINDKHLPAYFVDALSKKIPGAMKLTPEKYDEAKRVFIP